MANCPCCSSPLLRQYRSKEITWFCRHCWQEMPNFNFTHSGHFSYRKPQQAPTICN